MNERDEPMERSPATDQELPADLIAAIERARRRTASPAAVAQLTVKVLQLSNCQTPQLRQPISVPWNGRIAWTVAIAASILMILTFKLWLPAPKEPPGQLQSSELLNRPVYSPITTVSLVQVGYRKIEQDLDRADEKLDDAFESLALAAVRREVQETLEEFYDWSR